MVDWLGWLRRMEFTAIGAIVIAALSLIIGQSAQQFAETTAPSAVRLAGGETQAQAAARLNVIDFATTGSIKGRAIVLSPCKAQD
jgi:hypothetical protein